jgi:hypothetical protein
LLAAAAAVAAAFLRARSSEVHQMGEISFLFYSCASVWPMICSTCVLGLMNNSFRSIEHLIYAAKPSKV